jgi:hypothetical protein
MDERKYETDKNISSSVTGGGGAIGHSHPLSQTGLYSIPGYAAENMCIFKNFLEIFSKLTFLFYSGSYLI